MKRKQVILEVQTPKGVSVRVKKKRVSKKESGRKRRKKSRKHTGWEINLPYGRTTRVRRKRKR
jgi:hypothetical protein